MQETTNTGWLSHKALEVLILSGFWFKEVGVDKNITYKPYYGSQKQNGGKDQSSLPPVVNVILKNGLKTGQQPTNLGMTREETNNRGLQKKSTATTLTRKVITRWNDKWNIRQIVKSNNLSHNLTTVE